MPIDLASLDIPVKPALYVWLAVNVLLFVVKMVGFASPRLMPSIAIGVATVAYPLLLSEFTEINVLRFSDFIIGSVLGLIAIGTHSAFKNTLFKRVGASDTEQFMKNLSLLTVLGTSLLLGVLLFAGCATTGSGDSQLQVEDFTPAIKTAAFAGTWYALKEHPEWREGFQIAAKELAVLETVERLDFATVMAIVLRLPVDELQSSEATLAITGATILLSGYGGRVVELDKLNRVQPIAGALRSGIELGLGSPR